LLRSNQPNQPENQHEKKPDEKMEDNFIVKEDKLKESNAV
jgi:hypothetical protein